MKWNIDQYETVAFGTSTTSVPPAGRGHVSLRCTRVYSNAAWEKFDFSHCVITGPKMRAPEYDCLNCRIESHFECAARGVAIKE